MKNLILSVPAYEVPLSYEEHQELSQESLSRWITLWESKLSNYFVIFHWVSFYWAAIKNRKKAKETSANSDLFMACEVAYVEGKATFKRCT